MAVVAGARLLGRAARRAAPRIIALAFFALLFGASQASWHPMPSAPAAAPVEVAFVPSVELADTVERRTPAVTPIAESAAPAVALEIVPVQRPVARPVSPSVHAFPVGAAREARPTRAPPARSA